MPVLQVDNPLIESGLARIVVTRDKPGFLDSGLVLPEFLIVKR